ncbi:MAG: hypothetical protein IJ802_04240, partial [Kiritimatiellae bacterium]|nr:hypothetical protein [Kiritimatiellia bacterium]
MRFADTPQTRREWFERLENALREERDEKKRERLALYLLHFANFGGHGYYSSPELEKFYTDTAAKIPMPQDDGFAPGTCLIVMTHCAIDGGHTRVVERWIETDTSRRYSLVLLEDVLPQIPPRLQKAVSKSGGVLFRLKDGASELRRVSMQFECVLLFTHMYDPMPLVAYGVNAFPRPVGFYNHADHLFWLGVSIADRTAELRKWGAALSHDCRGVRGQDVVSVPLDAKPLALPDGAEVRRELGIPQDARVVVTAGFAPKYRPNGTVDMVHVLEKILAADARNYVIGIGMTFEEYPAWEALSGRYGNRLKAIGVMPHDLLVRYYAAADLVIDSLPIGGITALADALRAGCPVLSCMATV